MRDLREKTLTRVFRPVGVAFALGASLLTQPLLALAQSAIGDDLPRPLPVPRALWDEHAALLTVGFAALAAALLSWALLRLLANSDPRRAALHRIERARRTGRGAEGQAFASELGEAVRAYVEVRFAVHAPSLSTEAVLADLAQAESAGGAPWRAPLADFLVCADLAKDGAAPLSAPERDALVDSARQFVNAS